MRPALVQPKRSDYASFDDYFDAMIEYHLKHDPKKQDDLQIPTSFVQSFDLKKPNARELASISKTWNGSEQLPEMKRTWRAQLQQFVQLHQQ